MNTMKRGIDAVNTLKSGSLLLDSSLVSLNLFIQDFVVICELVIKPRLGAEFSEVILRVEGIKRFDFYYDEANDFYLIDRYKLILTEGMGVYLSLDPYDETDAESENDCGVIVGKGVILRVS